MQQLDGSYSHLWPVLVKNFDRSNDKLAILKTVSDYKFEGWSELKASTTFQSTAYGM